MVQIGDQGAEQALAEKGKSIVFDFKTTKVIKSLSIVGGGLSAIAYYNAAARATSMSAWSCVDAHVQHAEAHASPAQWQPAPPPCW